MVYKCITVGKIDNQTATDVVLCFTVFKVPTIVLFMNCLRKYLSEILAIMVQLWSCLLLVLASLCAVHTKTYPEAKNTDGLRTGYHHFPGVGYYRSVRHHFMWQLLCGTYRRYFAVCFCVCVRACAFVFDDRVSGIIWWNDWAAIIWNNVVAK